LFLAVELPESIREEVAALCQRLRNGFQFTQCRPNWCRPETIHLTLIFLGQTPMEQIGPISDAAGRAAAPFSPLRIEIKRLGVFPHWRRPRVLWAGVRERTHQIDSLHQALQRSLAALGYRIEEKPFKPHLTLARIKSLRGIEAARSIAEDHQGFRFGPFAAGELVLFKSQLHPEGAIHTPLERFPLTGASGNDTAEQP
jgi:2'-5' RNA ligase